jgi:toxin-antitoxin system PIN domain toxin
LILPDVNLLLYATIAAFEEHRAARAWWERTLSEADDVALCAPVVFGYLRIATNPRIFEPPMAVADALARVENWLARANVHFVLPGPDHLTIAFALLRDLGTAANLTTDVQLAALAIEYQAEVHSSDSDFARFPGLRWTDPLAAR